MADHVDLHADASEAVTEKKDQRQPSGGWELIDRTVGVISAHQGTRQSVLRGWNDWRDADL